MIKKYAVEDNCWAKLETSIDATATKIRIKETHNLPQSWEWIATLSKKQGDEIIKMEKVLVVKRELNLLTVQRGFQSTAQAWEENDVLNLYITAEIIREIQRGFDKKADLIDGKVPASQLPEVSQIDESNLVHKTWDETIGGKKSFNEGVYFDRSFGLNTLDANGNKTKLYWNSLRAPNNHHHILPDLVNQDGGVSSIYIGYNGQQNEIGLSVKWKTNYLLIKDDLNMYINDQNRTGERQDYTPTLSGSWGGTPAKYWSQRWRYKIIWKMCFWWAKVEFQKWTLSGRPYISLPNKSKWEWESIGAESLVWWTGTTLKNTYWYASINDGKIEILHWFGQAGDWSAIQSWDTAISVKFFYEIE